jgi:hypothetical protein
MDPPKPFIGNGFIIYGSCGPCFIWSYSNLVHPYCDFCLLGLTDLLPQEPSLLVKELV